MRALVIPPRRVLKRRAPAAAAELGRGRSEPGLRSVLEQAADRSRAATVLDRDRCLAWRSDALTQRLVARGPVLDSHRLL